MNKLYPPQIEGIIPAFTGTDITVPFSMNKAVSLSEISGMELKFKTLQNDTFLFTIQSRKNSISQISGDNFEVTFPISDKLQSKIAAGNFYKLQIAYIYNNDDVGYYSTVGVVKYTTKPTVEINDLKSGGLLNQFRESYLGTYEQIDGDTSEKVYSYRYIFYDKDKNIIEDSGDLLHNSTFDSNWYNSQDEFRPSVSLAANEVYYVQYIITTQNNLVVKSPTYKIIDASESMASDIKGDLVAHNNYNNGYIELTFEDYDDVEPMVGTFELSRSVNSKWEVLHNFTTIGGNPSSWSFKDFTIEQGITYSYGVRQYNANNGIYSARKELVKVYNDEFETAEYANEIFADFEDAFLYDGKRQLKIRYNPKVSSFKTTILEQKTDTIGSKYPYFTRNGRVEYKDFPISGMISYLSDEEELFMSSAELGIVNDTFTREFTKGALVSKFVLSDKPYNKDESYYTFNGVSYDRVHPKRSEYRINKYFIVEQENPELLKSTTDNVGYNIKAERLFKLSVLNWLNNGEPKLFKSPYEGNYVVRLMNISLNPNEQLGRMIHSFNCNAYEIDKFSLNTLKDKNINIIDKEKEVVGIKQVLYSTYEIIAGKEYINNNSTASYVEITDMMPGSTVTINGHDFVIGTTGTFKFNVDDNITSIISNSSGGQITIGRLDFGESTFDRYEKTELQAVPVRQWIGPNKDVMEDVVDICHELINMPYARFIRREVENIYRNNDTGKYYTSYQDLLNGSNGFEISEAPSSLDRNILYKIRAEKTYELEDGEPNDFSNNRDYYIDYQLDKFFPYDGAYLDLNTGSLFSDEEYNIFGVYFYKDSDEYVDLKDIYMVEYSNLEKEEIEQIVVGPGVIAELTYNVLEKYYTYNDLDFKEAYKNYDNAKTNFDNDVETWKSLKEAYKVYLEQVKIQTEKYLARFAEEEQNELSIR